MGTTGNKTQRPLEKESKEDEQTLALNKARLDRMMKEVEEISSTDQVPLAYAIDRLTCSGTFEEGTGRMVCHQRILG